MSAKHTPKHMAGPVKRGPSPRAVVAVFVVVVAMVGVAVWAMRSRLPFELPADLPEAPKIDIPQELPIDLPWDKESSEGRQQTTAEENPSQPTQTESAAPPAGAAEAVGAVDSSQSQDTAPVDEVAPVDSVENAANVQAPMQVEAVPNGEPAEVVQDEAGIAPVEEVETAVPEQPVAPLNDAPIATNEHTF